MDCATLVISLRIRIASPIGMPGLSAHHRRFSMPLATSGTIDLVSCTSALIISKSEAQEGHHTDATCPVEQFKFRRERGAFEVFR
jgi:hypothetical protein